MKIQPVLFIPLLVFACSNVEKDHAVRIDLHPVAEQQPLTLIEDTITFAVDAVELAPSFLPVYAVKDILQWKTKKEISYTPVDPETDSLVYLYGFNGLMQTVHYCYDEHRPLILSPDAIWLTICQGVSIHINQHFDRMSPLLFKANKPDQLIARNDTLAENNEAWISLIADLSNQIEQYTVANTYDFFIPKFSTSNSVHTTAYQITLMEVYKQAFTFIGESGCGIPSISIRGNTADWESIYEKLELLDQFDLSEWKNELKPIISQFIEASKGNINRNFWREIYKNAMEYNGFYTSGWIIKFFPYINSLETNGKRDEEYGMEQAVKTYRANPFLYGTTYRKSTLSPSDFPDGISEVNITWENHFTGITKEMYVYAGFFGAKQNLDLSLEPFISWAIAEKNAPKIESHPNWRSPIAMEHELTYWSPKFAKKVDSPAIYNVKKFDTYENSMAYLKQLLIDSLSTNQTTAKVSLTNLIVVFELYTNGDIGEITLKGSDAQLSACTGPITNFLQELPEPWLPALAHPSSVLRLMGEPIDPKLRVFVNSYVEIRF